MSTLTNRAAYFIRVHTASTIRKPIRLNHIFSSHTYRARGGEEGEYPIIIVLITYQ